MVKQQTNKKVHFEVNDMNLKKKALFNTVVPLRETLN